MLNFAYQKVSVVVFCFFICCTTIVYLHYQKKYITKLCVQPECDRARGRACVLKCAEKGSVKELSLCWHFCLNVIVLFSLSAAKHIPYVLVHYTVHKNTRMHNNTQAIIATVCRTPEHVLVCVCVYVRRTMGKCEREGV